MKLVDSVLEDYHSKDSSPAINLDELKDASGFHFRLVSLEIISDSFEELPVK